MKKIVFIRITTITILCFGVNKIYAQSEAKKFRYTFNSGIGMYNPLIRDAKLASSGLLFSFQLQANYKTKYFSRIAFSQFSLDYKGSFKLNGLNIKMEDRLETLTLGIDLGYVFYQKNKFNSYAFLDTGVAAIYTPIITYDNGSTDFNISKQVNLFQLLNTGIGFEYKLHKLLILSAEFQYTDIPYKTDLSNTQLNGIISQLNFKTNF